MAILNSVDDAIGATSELRKMLDGSMKRLDRIDDYLNGEQRPPYTPREANTEYRQLVNKSITNWMQLVLSAPAQAMYVDGYRTSGQAENARPWRIWQANGLDARQSAIYRAAMGYGLSYTLTVDATDPMTGETMPQIRGVSPRRMVAAYSDPHDDWAEFALRVVVMREKEWEVELYDDEKSWTVRGLRGDMSSQWSITAVDAGAHGASVVPVVRFADMPDLEGRHPGMIEPLMPIQDRINQTSFDLLMTQTFASWVVRTVSGMALIDEFDDQSDEGAELSAAQYAAARAAKLRLSQDRMLVAEDPDTKFGTLDASPLTPFVEAQEANVRHLAAVSQTPPHHLLGQMANLSAEALAAAESSLQRKVSERQAQFGEAWEQTLRLAAQIAGDVEAARDMDAEVHWRDTESRSFAATVDGLTKAAAQEGLAIPRRGLWELFPGVTQQQLEQWTRLADEQESIDAFSALLDGMTGGEPAGDPEPVDADS